MRIFRSRASVPCSYGSGSRRGSHHIFTRFDVEEILNLEPREAKAKPYQVKQVRQVILKCRLGGADDA